MSQLEPYVLDADPKVVENTAGLATDVHMKMETDEVYNEGFSAAHGVRPETAETDGRIRHPEIDDASTMEVDDLIDRQNPGLADNTITTED